MAGMSSINNNGGSDTPGAGEIRELISNTELLRIMECPICKEVALPPIYNCIRGHIICSECRQRISECGVCKEPVSEGRSFPLEDIVGNSSFNCRFRGEGCMDVLRGDILPKHLEECWFRPVACAMCDDEKKIPFTEFMDHLRLDHYCEGKDHESDRIEFQTTVERRGFDTDNTFVPDYFHYDGKYFLFHAEQKNNAWYNWISLVGSEDEASQYQVTVILLNDNANVPRVEWKLQVTSVRQRAETAYNSLWFDWNQVEPYIWQATQDPITMIWKYVWKTLCVIQKLP